ncbi:MAG: hypothetical protein ACLFTN_08545 [Phycisphaerae bacterium]
MKQIHQPDHPSLPVRVLRAAGSTRAALGVVGALWVYLAWVSVWTHQAAELLGTTPEGVYRHPILLVLVGLLCASMAIVTRRRIPLGLTTLGAWCAHAGAIVLILGGAWYAAAHVQGDALFVRSREGFTPVSYAYMDGTAAIAAGASDRTSMRQTPIDWPAQLREPMEVDVPVNQPLEGVRLRAVKLLPAVMLQEVWTDDAPVDIPAARVAVIDTTNTTRGVLCNAYERTAVLTGAGWTMSFDGDANADQLATLARPGPLVAGHDRITLLWGPTLEPTLLVRRADRSTSHVAFDSDGQAVVRVADRRLRVRLLERFAHAQPTLRTIPDGHGPKQRAAVVELSTADHTRRRILPFTPYPLEERPQRVWLPDGRSLDLHLGRAAMDLGATVTITQATYHAQPGSVIPRDYVCDLLIGTDGNAKRETLRLNQPVRVGPFQLNQGSWSPDPADPTTIRLTVTTRPALGVIWTGLALMLAGVTWAMLVKPILRRRRRP